MSKAEMANDAKRLREQLSKLRHWMTGYEMGSGNVIPNVDAARLTVLFLDKIIREAK